MVTTAWRHLGKQSHSGKHAVLDKVRLTCPMLYLPVSKALTYIFRSPTSFFYLFFFFLAMLRRRSLISTPFSSRIRGSRRSLTFLIPTMKRPRSWKTTALRICSHKEQHRVRPAVGYSLLMRQILPREVKYSSIPTGCVQNTRYSILSHAAF
jgi:hypothetical protein